MEIRIWNVYGSTRLFTHLHNLNPLKGLGLQEAHTFFYSYGFGEGCFFNNEKFNN